MDHLFNEEWRPALFGFRAPQSGYVAAQDPKENRLQQEYRRDRLQGEPSYRDAIDTDQSVGDYRASYTLQCTA